jgi:hypothetical protein
MPQVAKTLTAPTKTSCDDVLKTLRSAYPNGVSTAELVRLHGVAVKSRIGELRLDGWDITTADKSGMAYYTLTSLACGRPSRVLAGCTIRFDNRDGWSSRSHVDGLKYGHYSLELLQQAEAAALQAYMSVLNGPPQLPPADDFLTVLENMK